MRYCMRTDNKQHYTIMIPHCQSICTTMPWWSLVWAVKANIRVTVGLCHTMSTKFTGDDDVYAFSNEQ
jgi:hypothetical protein